MSCENENENDETSDNAGKSGIVYVILVSGYLFKCLKLIKIKYLNFSFLQKQD